MTAGVAGEAEEPQASAVSVCAIEFLNSMSVEKGASANTVAAYRRVLREYAVFLAKRGVLEPGSIGREDVREFAESLSRDRGLGARSVAQAASAIRSFHRFMLREGLAFSDETVFLESPKLPGRLPHALNASQVEALTSSPEGNEPLAVRDRLILEILYATGMRISELVSLDVGDVDLVERIVAVHGKGGKWRLVPFGSVAARAARAYLLDSRPSLAQGSRTQALVLNSRGGRLTRQGCWKIVKSRADSVGLADVVTPHTLRHTFATHLLEGGAGLIVVQELLGHSSVATTQIYTEVTRDHLKSVYRRTHPRS